MTDTRLKVFQIALISNKKQGKLSQHIRKEKKTMRKDIVPIITKIRNGNDLTPAEKQYFIHYSMTTNHTGKMYGLASISTSVLENPYCQARRCNNKLVCAECYAASQLERQETTREKELASYIFYNNVCLSESDVPFLNYAFVRFEAFGDTASDTCQENYITIAKANKTVHFVQWTKNINTAARAVEKMGKPENMEFIYSIPKINFIPTEKFIRLFRKKYPFVKKIFCVYTEEFAAENKIAFNCPKYCSTCMRCYIPGTDDFVIYERKK